MNILKKIYKKIMNNITINGQTLSVTGNNVQAVTINGKTKITVNGITVVDEIQGSQVTIKWEGEVANLDCNSAEIKGNINGNIKSSSVVIHGNVTGDIKSTSVECGDVNGDIDSTSVECKKITGNVKAISVSY